MAGIPLKKQCGAVVLSECLNCVALIRRGDVWNFPYAIPTEGQTEAAAAVSIVQEMIGLDITDRFKMSDYIEAEASPLTKQTAKLFVAVNVPENDLTPGAGVDEAVWRPLEEFLRRGDDEVVNASLPHLAFLPGLRRYIERHPELQTESVPSALKSGLSYHPATWEGVTPKEHLAEWCQTNELPILSYLNALKGKEKYLGTCVLSSVGVQVTPIELFATAELAEQNAALFAIVYLEGGFSGFSPYCRVVPVGFNPEQRPESIVPLNDSLPEEERLEIMRANMLQEVNVQRMNLRYQLKELDKQCEILESGGEAAFEIINRHQQTRRASARPNRGRGAYSSYGRGRGGPYAGGRYRGGPMQKRPKVQSPVQDVPGTPGDSASPGPDGQVGKTPVQILKEHCDSRKWNQPTYEFKDLKEENQSTKPLFKCFVSVKEANIFGLESSVESTHRSAKSSAARAALQALRLA